MINKKIINYSNCKECIHFKVCSLRSDYDNLNKELLNFLDNLSYSEDFNINMKCLNWNGNCNLSHIKS